MTDIEFRKKVTEIFADMNQRNIPVTLVTCKLLDDDLGWIMYLKSDDTLLVKEVQNHYDETGNIMAPAYDTIVAIKEMDWELEWIIRAGQ